MQLQITRYLSTASRNFDELTNPLVGSSPRMRVVRTLIFKFANDSSTVLFTGAKRHRQTTGRTGDP
jgi:DNA-binding NtrC family response regulator